ncbi:MAG: hypothetical protein II404_00115, partial [Prevotella sp.]|nr:hypothetical protein [Prevotella sp.]
VLRADKRINDLELEREKLIEKVSKNHLDDILTAVNMLKEGMAEKISKNYLEDILRAVNMLKEGLTEKKNKVEKVERGLELIVSTLSRIE